MEMEYDLPFVQFEPQTYSTADNLAVWVLPRDHAIHTKAQFAASEDCFLSYKVENGTIRNYDLLSLTDLRQFGNTVQQQQYLRGRIGEHIAHVIFKELCISLHKKFNSNEHAKFKFKAYEGEPNKVIEYSAPYIALFGDTNNVIIRMQAKDIHMDDSIKEKCLVDRDILRFFPHFIAEIDSLMWYQLYKSKGVLVGEAKTGQIDIPVLESQGRRSLADRVLHPLHQLFDIDHLSYALMGVPEQIFDNVRSRTLAKRTITFYQQMCQLAERENIKLSTPLFTFNESAVELQQFAAFAYRRYVQRFEPDTAVRCTALLSDDTIILQDQNPFLTLRRDPKNASMWHTDSLVSLEERCSTEERDINRT